MRPDKVFTYRGPIERGADYHGCDGYSETAPNGGIIYPWSTKHECQSKAKRDGFRAVFARENHCDFLGRAS